VDRLTWETIETDTFRGSQSWERVDSVNLGPHRLRLHVRRNAYDAQSFGQVDRWNGDAWVRVLRVPLSHMPLTTRAIRYVDRLDDGDRAAIRVLRGLADGVAALRARAERFFETLPEATAGGES